MLAAKGSSAKCTQHICIKYQTNSEQFSLFPIFAVPCEKKKNKEQNFNVICMYYVFGCVCVSISAYGARANVHVLRRNIYFELIDLD